MFEQWGVVHLGTYLVGLFLIIVLPGPNSLFVLTTSAARGVSAGYRAACGVFLGDTVLVILTAAGASTLLQQYPVLFFTLKAAGAAYLFYIGAHIVYAFVRPQPTTQAQAVAVGEGGYFRRALLLSLLNPKAILFLVSFFVQFVDPTKGHSWLAFMVLGAFLQLFSFTYLSILIFGGAKLAAGFRRYRRLSKIANLAVAILFIGFAFRMLFESQ